MRKIINAKNIIRILIVIILSDINYMDTGKSIIFIGNSIY